MLPRVYLPAAAAESSFHLNAEQSRHLIKVLRLKRGDTVEIFNGAGSAYHAHIIDDNKNCTVIHTAAAPPYPAAADSGRAVHIGQVMCAAAKMDWAVEKMTELGAAGITPLINDSAKYTISRRQIERWRRLTIAASEQCGRNLLPELFPPQRLMQWRPPAGQLILLTPRAEHSLFSIVSALQNNCTISIIAGGESGFSKTEEAQLGAAGFQPAHLGARILRAETAALAALALITALGSH